MSRTLSAVVGFLLLVLLSPLANASTPYEELKEKGITKYSRAGGEWWQLNYAVNDVPIYTKDGRLYFIDGNDQAILLEYQINGGDSGAGGRFPQLQPMLDNINELNAKAKLYAFRDISIAVVILVAGLWFVKKKKSSSENTD